MTERRNIKKIILFYLAIFQDIKRHIVDITDLPVLSILYTFPISIYFGIFLYITTFRFMLILLNDFDFLQ